MEVRQVDLILGITEDFKEKGFKAINFQPNKDAALDLLNFLNEELASYKANPKGFLEDSCEMCGGQAFFTKKETTGIKICANCICDSLSSKGEIISVEKEE